MRRVVAGVFAAGVVLAAGATTSAHAAARVDRQAWTRTGPLTTFVPAADRMYVAATAGAEEARAFVDVVTSGVDVSKAQLTLTEASDGMFADTAKVSACALGGKLGASGQLATGAPTADCTLQVPANRAADGRWTVALGVFASRWSAGASNGVALVPAVADPTATWRVSFDTTKTTVSAPAVVATAIPASPAPSEPAEAPVAEETPIADVPAAPEVTGPALPAEPAPSTAAAPSAPSATPAATGSQLAAARPQTSGTTSVKSATSPPVGVPMAILVILAIVIVAGIPRIRQRVEIPPRLNPNRAPGALLAVIAIGLALLPLTASEVTVYKAGLVLIFLIAALGLHVLVNWAGQLSLAHAGLVGLPAFVVLTLSEIHNISPLYLLPVGAVVGGVTGGVVALPTLRAKGLQVALVTLAAGIAIDRFFFTKSWLVGPVGGRAASLPRIGPLEFTTSRSLYAVVVLLTVIACAGAWTLLHSKMARAWFWVRANPDAAAAFGVPVVMYRIFAFVASGVFAGLAGGMTVMWVQRLTPQAFPTTLSYTYLLVAVLAGPGFVGGLAVAAAVLEGGRLFSTGAGTLVSYLGPIALIATITRYEAGINGAGRSLMERLRLRGLFKAKPDGEGDELEPIGLVFLAGVVAVLAGFVAIGVAWYHAGNTNQTWVQNQELISGGIGGLALVLVGVGLLIRDRLGRNQDQLSRQLAEALGTKTNGFRRRGRDDVDTLVTTPASRRKRRSASDN